MAFELKKLIGFLLLPFTVSLILMGVGMLIVGRERFRTWGKRLLVGGLVWLVITSNRGVGTALVSVLERQYPAQGDTLAGAVTTCKVVVILGAGHADTASLAATHRLSPSALARLVEGVRIAHALPAAELWVSGPGANPSLPTHASVLRASAVALGLSPDRVVELTTGRDTEGEASAVRARWPHPEPVALVTSAWHMPRAVALFRKAGLAVVPCPADYASRWNDDLRLGDYLAWDVSGLERSTKAIYEFLGLTWSKLTGRL
jgi:uncharacterized SAM-binding protein YcdF (DUF218 family)